VEVRGHFIGAVDPPETPTPLAWWFAFAGDRLVLEERRGEDYFEILRAVEVRALGLEARAQHYLGQLDGHDCWAVDLGMDTYLTLPEGFTSKQLRGLHGRMDDDLFAMSGRAIQIIAWGRTHRFCGQCGAAMEQVRGERAMKCPACGLINYPRLSPAVIVQVTRGDTILLARNANFPAAFFSVVAGFVEAGESLEQTVRRELREEVGIEVEDIRYFGSQPWPFPNSLMVGFTAKWAANEITVDPRELAEADWFAADALPNIPPPLSIARRLIDDFVAKHGPGAGKND
jgi:NAD+ diphosphatase